MVDHERIWLSPRCPLCCGEDRTWCKDNVWSEGCDPTECTAMPTEYVRADVAAAEVEALRDLNVALQLDVAKVEADAREFRARVVELEDALDKIASGDYPEGTSLAVNNSYRELCARLQTIALAALEALPSVPEPAGETVEVRGCVGVSESGEVYGYCSNRDNDDELRWQVESADYQPTAMFTIRVPKSAPSLPTITTTVEPGA